MNIASAVLAPLFDPLPPIKALGYEYVLGAHGLYIRAECKAFEACVPVASCEGWNVRAVGDVMPYFRLKVPRIGRQYLDALYEMACHALPNESMFQFAHTSEWVLSVPVQSRSKGAVRFVETSRAVVDIHTHGAMQTFWSNTDDADEQGLKAYVVLGGLPGVDGLRPEIRCRVGVYGYMMDIWASQIFESDGRAQVGPFIDQVVAGNWVSLKEKPA